MRRLILVLLLIFAAGCATLPSSRESAVSPVQPSPAQAKELPAPAPVAEKAEPPVVRETSVGSAPPVSTEAALPTAPEKTVAKLQETPPIAQRKQEQAPPARELPVPDHKLQGLVDLAEKNDEKIANVYVGMYRKTVEDIMGTVRNPYKREAITCGDDQVYEIVYYLTREPRKGRPITDRMLTPVIYKKGRVAAIGSYKLKKLIRTGTLGRQKPAKETPPSSS